MVHSDFCPEVSQKPMVPICLQDTSRWVQIAKDSFQDRPRWLPIVQDRVKLAQKGCQGGAFTSLSTWIRFANTWRNSAIFSRLSRTTLSVPFKPMWDNWVACTFPCSISSARANAANSAFLFCGIESAHTRARPLPRCNSCARRPTTIGPNCKHRKCLNQKLGVPFSKVTETDTIGTNWIGRWWMPRNLMNRSLMTGTHRRLLLFRCCWCCLGMLLLLLLLLMLLPSTATTITTTTITSTITTTTSISKPAITNTTTTTTVPWPFFKAVSSVSQSRSEGFAIDATPHKCYLGLLGIHWREASRIDSEFTQDTIVNTVPDGQQRFQLIVLLLQISSASLLPSLLLLLRLLPLLLLLLLLLLLRLLTSGVL